MSLAGHLFTEILTLMPDLVCDRPRLAVLLIALDDSGTEREHGRDANRFEQQCYHGCWCCGAPYMC